MARAFEELFAVPDAFRGIPMPGRTDAWILTDAAAVHGIPADSPDLRRFPDVYLRYLHLELDGPSPRGARSEVMPGVRVLLETLSRTPGVFLALLTGNYEAAAHAKLEHFDLWHFFACGAFGDNAPDRNGLLPRAIDRVSACGGPRVTPTDVVVIGDTPLDVACAAAGGARSIAVATGRHSSDELRASGADVVFEDLSDLGAVLRALNVTGV